MSQDIPERLVHPSGAELKAKGRDLRQVKYGQAAGLTTLEKQRVTGRLLAVPGLSKRPREAVTDRLSQYSPDHIDYVHAAQRAGRPLTEQEEHVRVLAEAGEGPPPKKLRAPDASINHVIAAGTGQNTLNSSIAQFTRARQAFDSFDPGSAAVAPADWRGDDKGQRTALAEQAAAVGRMQTYSRAIAHENLTPDQRAAAGARDRPGAHRDSLPAADAGRNASLRQLLGILQGPGQADGHAYDDLMKSTFDSPGNLRVGDASLNRYISTGFDPEATAEGTMTDRSRRLLAAHLTVKPDHDDAVFSRLGGEVMSSSRTVGGAD